MKKLVILKLMLELLGEMISLALRAIDWFMRVTLIIGVLTLVWIFGFVFVVLACAWYLTGPTAPPRWEPYE